MIDPGPVDVEEKVDLMMKLMMLSVAFVAVGYLLVLGALYLEMNQFHPAVESYYGDNTKQARDAAAAGSQLNQQLAEIKKFPSTLLWMKLGGIAHILVGIFISLFVIVQALLLMPMRLAEEMDSGPP